MLENSTSRPVLRQSATTRLHTVSLSLISQSEDSRVLLLLVPPSSSPIALSGPVGMRIPCLDWANYYCVLVSGDSCSIYHGSEESPKPKFLAIRRVKDRDFSVLCTAHSFKYEPSTRRLHHSSRAQRPRHGNTSPGPCLLLPRACAITSEYDRVGASQPWKQLVDRKVTSCGLEPQEASILTCLQEQPHGTLGG